MNEYYIKEYENKKVLLDDVGMSIMIMVGWLVGFYGISTFVGYLIPNPFLCK